ncbi:MAG: hypothetical protein M0C28_26825 [Candidatus Moduliflexus flocculans]|nr:hypothetical protein [Candidatus Moduliflexus flocculans]
MPPPHRRQTDDHRRHRRAVRDPGHGAGIRRPHAAVHGPARILRGPALRRPDGAGPVPRRQEPVGDEDRARRAADGLDPFGPITYPNRITIVSTEFR